VPLASELPRALLPRSYQTGFRKGGYLLPISPLVPLEPSDGFRDRGAGLYS